MVIVINNIFMGTYIYAHEYEYLTYWMIITKYLISYTLIHRACKICKLSAAKWTVVVNVPTTIDLIYSEIIP